MARQVVQTGSGLCAVRRDIQRRDPHGVTPAQPPLLVRPSGDAFPWLVYQNACSKQVVLTI